MQTIQGIVYGKTIQLIQDPGLTPGQVVTIQLPASESPPRVWGDGIRKSAGVAADVPGTEEAWAEIEAARKRS